MRSNAQSDWSSRKCSCDSLLNATARHRKAYIPGIIHTKTRLFDRYPLYHTPGRSTRKKLWLLWYVLAAVAVICEQAFFLLASLGW